MFLQEYYKTQFNLCFKFDRNYYNLIQSIKISMLLKIIFNPIKLNSMSIKITHININQIILTSFDRVCILGICNFFRTISICIMNDICVYKIA